MRHRKIDHTWFAGLLLAVGAHSANAADTPRCDSITGGGSKVSSQTEAGCIGCTIDHPEAAADGRTDRFASLTLFSLAGASLRATAQPGIVYPAGGRAGVLYSPPANNPNGDNIDAGGTWSYGVRTYLRGTLQETGSSPVDDEAIASGPSAAQRYLSIETTKPYDAVEAYFSDAQVRIGGQGQVTPGSAAFKVYELCSDGGVRE